MSIPHRAKSAGGGAHARRCRHNLTMNQHPAHTRRTGLILAMVLCAGMLAHGAARAADSADDAAAGEVKFNTYCRTCHSWMKGDNRLGPSLYGVVGRKAGTAPGYAGYSGSMKSSGIVWTREMIDKWITNPYKILPDTNMRPFPGIPDPATRKKIIAFLASHHDPAH